LLLEPRFIVADEPLAGLDPIVSTQLLDLMLSLKHGYGLTYLFISHDLDTVTYVSDRIGVMYRGKIVEMINSERFASKARHPYTRFLLTPAPQVSEPALNGGVHLHDQRSERGCLFLKKCTHSTRLCTELSPPLREIAPGHQVACHLVD
jgi:oligopeptide/dipeptide ABC transporter ATP-binding protein